MRRADKEFWHRRRHNAHRDRNLKRVFAFVSTMGAVPWGGSELLWSGAAERLVAAGHDVHASVLKWPQTPHQIDRLRREGIRVWERPWSVPFGSRLTKRAWRMIAKRELAGAQQRWLRRIKPSLLCISSGNAVEGGDWMRLARANGVPYVTVSQAHADFLWPDDAAGAELAELHSSAIRSFFVSQANLKLLQTQTANELRNAEIVRNPVNLARTVEFEWPDAADGVLRLASVARLHPSSKGQDLILQVLATPEWQDRELRVGFYGEGPQERLLRELSRHYGLGEKIAFHGQVNDIAQVWRENHVLILSSRYEGLPLALVEALMCGRPAIVTDVAGNSEVVEEGVTGFIAEAPTVVHLGRAMEKAWQARSRWKEMGDRAYQAIRRSVPPDPAEEFANRLLAFAGV